MYLVQYIAVDWVRSEFMEKVTLGVRSQELARWRRRDWQGVPGHGHGNERTARGSVWLEGQGIGLEIGKVSEGTVDHEVETGFHPRQLDNP